MESYRAFKQKFGFTGEIKGSALMTKENNEALAYFIDQFLDDKHFYICNYDKNFYIATLISEYILGREFQIAETLEFYQYTSTLAGEKEELFRKYCSAVQRNTDEAYSCKNTVNFVNMTALGELLLCLEHIHQIDPKASCIYHDNLTGYEEEYRQSFAESNIEIQFVDSKENELIQLADNVCSVYRKCFEKSFEAFQVGKQWTENIWFTENYSRIIHQIGMPHIKMVTPIADGALPYAVMDIFGTEHNAFQMRKHNFPQTFLYYRECILNEISGIDVTLPL